MKHGKVGLIWLIWGAITIGLAYILPDQPKFDAVGQIVIVVFAGVALALSYDIMGGK